MVTIAPRFQQIQLIREGGDFAVLGIHDELSRAAGVTAAWAPSTSDHVRVLPEQQTTKKAASGGRKKEETSQRFAASPSIFRSVSSSSQNEEQPGKQGFEAARTPLPNSHPHFGLRRKACVSPAAGTIKAPRSRWFSAWIRAMR
jgi:hypothetical protein